MPSLTIRELAILIVEPSAFQCKLIRSELEGIGCQSIESVTTLEEALQTMRAYPPDLVISAMYLPDGDGTDLVTRMREDETLAGLPFMLISSEDRVEALEPIRQAGSVAILPKPFRHEDLQRALSATLHFVDPEELELEGYDISDLRLLLVDDSHLARQYVRGLLSGIGIQHFVEAENGEQALALIERHTFDLIISDYHMPIMDGEQLTQHIRQHSSQPYVPILLLTSEQNQTRLTAVRQAGVNAVCNKPFDPRHIKALILGLLDGEA